MNGDAIKADITLTAVQAEFVMASLDSVVKQHGMTHAASALTIAAIVQSAFKGLGKSEEAAEGGTEAAE